MSTLSPRHLAIALALLLSACGEDAAPEPSDLPDQRPDLDAVDLLADSGSDLDLDMAEDLAPDAEMQAPDMEQDMAAADMEADMEDVCAGVDCGPGGTCRVDGAGDAVCDCAPGYVSEGGRCVLAPAAPAIANLPGVESGAVGQLDSFLVMASDANGDALTFTVNAAACSFPVAVDAAGRVSWTCPATVTMCPVIVTASDPGGLSDAEQLSISCTNTAPAITSTMPMRASEGAAYSYIVECQDPDDDALTLALDPATSCPGAALAQTSPNQATLTFTPGELDGGASCALVVRCEDGLQATSQAGMIVIEEVNQAPAHTTLPAFAAALWGRAGALQLDASDPDLPAQALSFSLVNASCSFPVVISAAGEVSFTCGGVETCAASVRVSDGQAEALGALAISCTNAAPSASAVAISPSPIAQAGATLSCQYTFADADGDADSSTIEWLVGGVAVASGATFSNYLPGDSVACRVTPRDGLASGSPVTSPALIAPDDLRVAAGITHTCAIKNGALYCWGDNIFGQLGDATTTDRSAPTPVRGMGAGVTALSVSTGRSCAIQSGALKCWGRNNEGQLGDGTTTDRSAPVQVTGLTADVTQLAAGAGHTCAIQRGALYCWGLNNFSQLGSSSPTQRTPPAQVAGMAAGVTAVAAGVSHSCAVRSGALLCWGRNDSGQLGDSSTTLRSAPTPVAGLGSGVTAASAGGEHTCAIHNGAAKCWGRNQSGQLGDGTTTTRTSAAQVSGLTADVAHIASGERHVCAVHLNRIQCWGENLDSQLGDNTTTPRSVPTTVPLP